MKAKMADNKKELERSALHKTIWDLANDLRGAVSGWDFKQYVLGMLFYRFISENLVSYVNGLQEDGFDYAKLPDNEIDDEQRNYILPPRDFL
jgi:type I restriction enzyme M protein